MSDEKRGDEPPKEPQTDAAPKPPLCPWEPTLTREEIRRRIEEPGGMTLEEFRKHGGLQ